MIGSFLTRTLILVFGYAYPAYECFKIVELNKPEIEQMRFWCQYWILVASLTVFERVGDTFVSWLPMYSEAKLAFFVYLWYPKTKGTTYVYGTFFQPYVAKHETEIDRNLLELRTRAGDIAVIYWQKAARYGQTRFFDILQYVASQSQSQPPKPRTVQHRYLPQQTHQAPSTTGSVWQQAMSHPQQPARTPASPTKSQLQEAANTGISQPVALFTAEPQKSSGCSDLPTSETPFFPAPGDVEPMQIEVSSVPPNRDSNPALQETRMEEAIRVTRARLRKRAATGGGPAAR